MDLGGERLGLDSGKETSEVAVVDNDDSVEAVVVTGNNDVDSSGSCVNERVEHQVDSRDLGDEGNRTGEQLCSPVVNTVSPSGSTPKKGHGLKKWKRYRREGVVTSVSPSLDSGKVLKRGISGINNPSSQSPKRAEDSQGLSDFVQSMNTLDNNLGGLSYFPAKASSSTVFAMGAVSENIEDRSSKSSTAASAPRHGIGMPFSSPISGDKKKPKNPIGKGFNNLPQMGQLVKGRADPSKKLRGGERVRNEKEISLSSLESDSRSSNFVFRQTGNRRQSEASVNYNEDSDEDIPGEPHFTDGQTAYSQAHAREAEGISLRDLGADFSWDCNQKNKGSHQSPTRRDPLAESFGTLDSAQEALEKELQKIKEIGKESYFTAADTAASVNSSEYLNGEDLAQDASGSLYIPEKITFLESTLEEAREALRIKGLKINELEATLQSACLRNGDTSYVTEGQKATRYLEPELEFLFAQKVEIDVKDIATANALSDAKTLLAEQKALVEEQLKLTTRLEQTECKVGKIKRQAEELKTYSAEIVDSVDAEYGKRRISKLTWYSLTQLVMVLVTLWAFYLQRISDSGVVVPT